MQANPNMNQQHNSIGSNFQSGNAYQINSHMQGMNAFNGNIQGINSLGMQGTNSMNVNVQSTNSLRVNMPATNQLSGNIQGSSGNLQGMNTLSGNMQGMNLIGGQTSSGNITGMRSISGNNFPVGTQMQGINQIYGISTQGMNPMGANNIAGVSAQGRIQGVYNAPIPAMYNGPQTVGLNMTSQPNNLNNNIAINQGILAQHQDQLRQNFPNYNNTLVGMHHSNMSGGGINFTNSSMINQPGIGQNISNLSQQPHLQENQLFSRNPQKQQPY